MTRIDKFVEEFAENVAAQTDALRNGDSKSGNKHAKKYIRAFEALRSLGDEGRDALIPLMIKGTRDDVRAMTAAFLLRHRHKDARYVLEEIAQGKGFVAFSAAETLKRWDEKTWQLDPV